MSPFVIPILCALFLGAGVFNAAGTSATRANYLRWGYPAWWCRVTGALEIVCAGLIGLPATRLVGLIAGAVIIAAAVATVLRVREISHLVPLALFAVLLGFAFALV